MHRLAFAPVAALMFAATLTAIPADALVPGAGVPATVVSVNPLMLPFGQISASYETALGPVTALAVSPFLYYQSLVLFGGLQPQIERLWVLATTVGIDFYPLAVPMIGPFFGGGLIGGYVAVGNAGTTDGSAALGVEFRAGYRVLFGRWALTPLVGIRSLTVLSDLGALQSAADLVLDTLRWRLALGMALTL